MNDLQRYLDPERVERDARSGAWRQGQREVMRDLAEKMRQAKVAFLDDVRALYAFMMDPAAPVSLKALAVAGLLYFICPFDVIPDAIPVLGYADDAAVIAAVVAAIGPMLAKYRTRAPRC